MRTLLLVSIVCSALLPNLASAQRNDPGWVENVPTSDREYDPDANRVMLYFIGEFLGQGKFRSDLGDAEGDMDATLGMGTRVEFPISQFLAIGGGVEFVSFKGDDIDRDGDFDLDIIGSVKGRYVIHLTESIDLEAFGALLFGFSAFFGDGGSINDSLYGFNLGFMGGAALMIGRIGILTELGIRHRRVYGDEPGLGDFSFAISQFAMHIGGVYTF